MKKKLLSLLIIFCMVIPFGLTLVSCGKKHTCESSTEWTFDDTHHWKTCTDSSCTEQIDYAEHDFVVTTTPATLEADGLETKTCETCGKVITTVLPIIVQTRDEQIAVLSNAVKPENYTGNLQEVVEYKTNSSDRINAAPTEIIDREYFVRTENGTAVSYSISSEKPASYTGGDYIYEAVYFETVEENNFYYTLGLDDEDNPTKLELQFKNYVGDNFLNAYGIDGINVNHDYLLKISNEATLHSTLLDTMVYYVNLYQGLFKTHFSDEFTYNTDDIEFDYNLEYEDGIYTATGTIVLDNLTHTNPLPGRKMDSFKVEFEVVYSNDLVIKNYSKFSYKIDNTPAVSSDDLTELYYITNVTYTREIHQPYITTIKNIIDSSEEVTATPYLESIRFHVNGELYAITNVEYNTTINEKISQTIESFYTSEGMDNFSSIAIYLDEAHTVRYDSTVDIYVNDFYGNDIYIEITPDEGYSVILTCYYIYFEDVDYEYELMTTVEIVVKDHEYTMSLEGINPKYDSNDPESELVVNYDDKITLDGETVTTTTFTPTENEYHVKLYYITTIM